MVSEVNVARHGAFWTTVLPVKATQVAHVARELVSPFHYLHPCVLSKYCLDQERKQEGPLGGNESQDSLKDGCGVEISLSK